MTRTVDFTVGARQRRCLLELFVGAWVIGIYPYLGGSKIPSEGLNLLAKSTNDHTYVTDERKCHSIHWSWIISGLQLCMLDSDQIVMPSLCRTGRSRTRKYIHACRENRYAAEKKEAWQRLQLTKTWQLRQGLEKTKREDSRLSRLSILKLLKCGVLFLAQRHCNMMQHPVIEVGTENIMTDSQRMLRCQKFLRLYDVLQHGQGLWHLPAASSTGNQNSESPATCTKFTP